MEIKLPNGMTVSGTSDQVNDVLAKLGYGSLGNDGIYYRSQSRGLIRIVDMDENHLRNAMLKMYREWAADLSNQRGIQLLQNLSNGPSNNVTFVALLKEYAKKVR